MPLPVPELTRSADIQLNKRHSLRRHFKMLSQPPIVDACKLGLAGLVSKRRDRLYRAGTSPHWIKVKNPKHPAMTAGYGSV
jgi:ATP-dependent DNA ligase